MISQRPDPLKKACALILALMALSSSSLLAQYDIEEEDDSLYWANIGLGANPLGLSMGFGLAYYSDSALLSLRMTNSGEFGVFIQQPPESVWDFGLMYGIASKKTLTFASASVGIAVVGVTRRGQYLSPSERSPGTNSYEEISFLTVGIPFEGQLFLTPSRYLGIGFSAYLNVNPRRSIGGLLISCQVGILQ